jgi:hypothetical protein
MKKLLATLAVTASILVTAVPASAGRAGIAIGDSHPTYGKKLFVMLEGAASLTKPYTITMKCIKGGEVVLDENGPVEGGGRWFQLGPTDKWTGGDATCTTALLQDGKRGPRQIEAITFIAHGA